MIAQELEVSLHIEASQAIERSDMREPVSKAIYLKDYSPGDQLWIGGLRNARFARETSTQKEIRQ